MSETRLKGIEGGSPNGEPGVPQADSQADSQADPRYTLRPPTLEDLGSLAGVIARGAAGDPDLVARVFAGTVSAGEFGTVLVRAIVDAQAREDFYFVLGDMWQHEPANIDEPPERWDYEPDPALVERGQAVGRDERWRSITRFNRARIAKRYEVGALPAKVLKSMWLSVRDKIDLSDFLDTDSLRAGASSGESGTGSYASTDGPTVK